jgi:hypothetical protein
MGIKTVFFLLIVLTTSAAPAQQDEQPQRIGVIYGTLIGRDGHPVPALRVTAFPVGVGIAGKLPVVKTDSDGKYRFEKLKLGRYTVYAHDEEAGYPDYSSSFYLGDTRTPEVELTVEHPEAELRVELPPKAGFLQIHLTDRNTGTEIRTMRAKLALADNPNLWISTSCYSSQVLLLPPDKDVQLHLTSDGFGAWDRSIHLRSEERLTSNVQLEPMKE